MADLNQLVEKALKTLDYVLEHPPIDYDGPERDKVTDITNREVQLKIAAAAAVLEFAASQSRLVAEEPKGCKHDERTNMTTMGPGPTIEVCRQCGVRFENGVEVKG